MFKVKHRLRDVFKIYVFFIFFASFSSSICSSLFVCKVERAIKMLLLMPPLKLDHTWATLGEQQSTYGLQACKTRMTNEFDGHCQMSFEHDFGFDDAVGTATQSQPIVYILRSFSSVGVACCSLSKNNIPLDFWTYIFSFPRILLRLRCSKGFLDVHMKLLLSRKLSSHHHHRSNENEGEVFSRGCFSHNVKRETSSRDLNYRFKKSSIARWLLRVTR